MNLKYLIHDKIWVINNFLDFKSYKNLHKKIIKERKNIKFSTTEGKWSTDLIKNIKPPLASRVKNYAPLEKLKTLIKYNPFHQLKDIKEMNCLIHYMKKGAGINWHDDHDWKYGITYYVNCRWNPQWGGEFMFKDKKNYGFIPFTKNSLVIVKSPLEHKVNPVINPIIPRITVQIFVK